MIKHSFSNSYANSITPILCIASNMGIQGAKQVIRHLVIGLARRKPSLRVLRINDKTAPLVPTGNPRAYACVISPTRIDNASHFAMEDGFWDRFASGFSAPPMVSGYQLIYQWLHRG